MKKLETTSFGLTPRVRAEHVVAMSGIYVDDYLTVGPPEVVDAFMTTLRKLWKTSEPQYLSFTQDLTFLGVTIEKKEEGLLLHQHNCTENLLNEDAAHLPARKRTTAGDPEHFKKVAPPPPDPSNPEHQEWIKRGQRILGGVLWLSTRTRPDLAYAVSATAQVLTKDFELLKVNLRHQSTLTPPRQQDCFTRIQEEEGTHKVYHLWCLFLCTIRLLSTPNQGLPFTDLTETPDT